jgi:hypothetical protein
MSPPREAGEATLPLREKAAPPPQEVGEAAPLPRKAGGARTARMHKAGEVRAAAHARLERVTPPLTLLVREGQRDESAPCVTTNISEELDVEDKGSLDISSTLSLHESKK